ncbi:hypothetical protein A1Q2_05959 [Trichosporon asahii var. asahii CBS 8904]|uniref:BTB domain-containing protein n=1 Tax=Trichosporon asahii var. asahii (strain CBS 8904) TaxID=1220162 RepID=K1WDR3_TRIAC|nr:hypothetical protein A1Q2_05959 [Trichosporon asahii var. asahii CBS 8904]
MPDSKSDIVDIRDHPDWQNGDFSLISADGWRIKLTISDTFRDALNADKPTITFTDPEMESKRVLSFFARLISHPADKSDTPIFGLETHLALIRFMRKHDCEHTLEVYFLYLKAALLSDRMRPMEAWVLGAVLDDSDICAAALRQETPQFQKVYWRAHCAHRYYAASPQIFNISDLPLTALSVVPPIHLHALDKVRRKNWEELVPEEQRNGYSVERLSALNASQEYAEVVAQVQRQHAAKRGESRVSSPAESAAKRQRT